MIKKHMKLTFILKAMLPLKPDTAISTLLMHTATSKKIFSWTNGGQI